MTISFFLRFLDVKTPERQLTPGRFDVLPEQFGQA